MKKALDSSLTNKKCFYGQFLDYRFNKLSYKYLLNIYVLLAYTKLAALIVIYDYLELEISLS